MCGCRGVPWPPRGGGPAGHDPRCACGTSLPIRVRKASTAPTMHRMAGCATFISLPYYSEEIPLAALGAPSVTRASRVEPTPDGRWTADLSPVGGPTLG